MGRQGGGLVRSELAHRLELVGERIRGLERVLVAYSGGVDSTLVLEIAHTVLGAGAQGVIARSPSLPRAELEAALGLAADRGLHVRMLDTHELEVEGYVRNEPDRCFYCKTELYALLAAEAGASAATVLDGFNRDDRADWRPGRRAATEHGVVSPLDEAGMGKDDVREAARELGLPNWDKPAAACLSSRIAYGQPVTVAALSRIEAAESGLLAAGFTDVRVRDLGGGAASVEVAAEQVARLLEPARRLEVEARLHALGFGRVDIAPGGYRRGRLNVAVAGPD
jgi:pyridinium-3,5-biscarboxylic acid mononucleotide sulfurtransferase